jgi:hypothetical protein
VNEIVMPFARVEIVLAIRAVWPLVWLTAAARPTGWLVARRDVLRAAADRQHGRPDAGQNPEKPADAHVSTLRLGSLMGHNVASESARFVRYDLFVTFVVR